MLRYNKAIQQNEWIQKGILVSVPEEEVMLMSKKVDQDGILLPEEEQKGFRLVDIEITYDDGTTDIVQSTIWESQVEARIFADGDEVEIAIQTEGKYAGRSKVCAPISQRLKDIEEDVQELKVNSKAGTGLKEENNNLARDQEKGSGGCITVAVIGAFLLVGAFIQAFIRGGGDVESGIEGVQNSVYPAAILAVIAFIAYAGFQMGKGSK